MIVLANALKDVEYHFISGAHQLTYGLAADLNKAAVLKTVEGLCHSIRKTYKIFYTFYGCVIVPK